MAYVATANYLNGVHDYFGWGQPSGGGSSIPVRVTPNLNLPIGGLLGGGSSGGGRSVNYMVNATAREVHDLNREEREEERQENRANSAACLGGIGTVLVAGLSALALRSYCNDLDELKRANQFKTDTLPLLSNEDRLELTPIINKHIEIVESKVARGRNIMVVTALALATAIAAFTGGMLAVSWLITASIVAGVIVASIAAFLIVWHCTEKTSLSIEMQHQIDDLRMRLEGQRV